MFWIDNNNNTVHNFLAFGIVVCCLSYAGFEFCVHVLSHELINGGNRAGTGKTDPIEGGIIDNATMNNNQNSNGGRWSGGPNEKNGLGLMDTQAANPRSCNVSKQSVPFQTFVGEILSNRNLVCFFFIYLLQQFDCSFEKNFFTVFLKQTVAKTLPAYLCSTTIGLSFILPWLGTILMTPLTYKIGVYEMLKKIFYARIVFSIVCFSIGGNFGTWFSAMFLLVNRVLSECVCRLCPIALSDLVDEDLYVRKRPIALSSSIMGMVTGFGKISQSVAPMVGYAFVLSKSNENATHVTENYVTENSSDFRQDDGGQNALLNIRIVVVIPIVVVFAQHFIWRCFTLHGSYLERVKRHAKSSSVSKESGLWDHVV